MPFLVSEQQSLDTEFAKIVADLDVSSSAAVMKTLPYEDPIPGQETETAKEAPDESEEHQEEPEEHKGDR